MRPRSADFSKGSPPKSTKNAEKTGLSGGGSVFAVPMDQVGAARPHRPTLIEEVSRKMRDTAGGTPALPYEEAAFFFFSPITHHK
jgi:hypothetical protein